MPTKMTRSPDRTSFGAAETSEARRTTPVALRNYAVCNCLLYGVKPRASEATDQCRWIGRSMVVTIDPIIR